MERRLHRSHLLTLFTIGEDYVTMHQSWTGVVIPDLLNRQTNETFVPGCALSSLVPKTKKSAPGSN